MPEVPGLPSDVYFGDAVRNLPDWRKHPQGTSHDDDADATPDEKKAVKAMLGFDPREIDDEATPKPKAKLQNARIPKIKHKCKCNGRCGCKH